MIDKLKNYAVLLASGKGDRFGSELPKQFLKIAGKTILERSVGIFEQNENINEIIVVIIPEYLKMAQNLLKKYKKVAAVLPGGLTRQESSYIGISAIKDEEANVLIHDCARPLLSQNILNNCIKFLQNYEAVTVACPLTDTITEIEDDFIKKIPKRSNYKNIQTPQGFRLSLIKKAHELSAKDEECTDDCSLIINHGLGRIFIVAGDSNNIKITYPSDIFLAERILKNR